MPFAPLSRTEQELRAVRNERTRDFQYDEVTGEGLRTHTAEYFGDRGSLVLSVHP